jgi:uncharacterized protein involved in tolerance to divalent cations
LTTTRKSSVAKPELVELVLTCGSWQEAQRIVDTLLEKRLAVHTELLPIKSRHLWKRRGEEVEAVKLIMQVVAEDFQKIEDIVKKLQSLDMPILSPVPVEATD